jgi:hypothetical protein
MGGFLYPFDWRQAAFVLSAILCFAAADVHKFSINTIFRTESFDPVLPTERVVVKSYGRGVVERLHDQAYHIYRVQKSALWIGCRVDDDDRVNRPITEIILSRLPLSRSRSIPAIELSVRDLHDVRIGDRAHDVLEKCGRPRRTYNRFLTDGLSFVTYEYFPKDKSACLRFYIDNDQVVAMGVSSEE